MKVCEWECFEYFYKTIFVSLYICIIYDLMRCIFIKHKTIRDILFSVVTAIIFIYFVIYTITGYMRWYVVCTMFLCEIIYFFGLSREVCKVLSYFTKKIKKILHLIFKFLLTVVRFFGKILSYIDKCNFMKLYRRGMFNEKDKI